MSKRSLDESEEWEGDEYYQMAVQMKQQEKEIKRRKLNEEKQQEDQREAEAIKRVKEGEDEDEEERHVEEITRRANEARELRSIRRQGDTESTSILGSIATNADRIDGVDGEEESYVAPSQFKEEKVIFMPFNLKDEREEGYFDANGNYVEYKDKKEVHDAWLDSLETTTNIDDYKFSERRNTDSDYDLARYNIKRPTKEKSAESDSEDEGPMSEAKAIQLKRKLIGALKPSESVIDALKRLQTSSQTGSTLTFKTQQQKRKEALAAKKRQNEPQPQKSEAELKADRERVATINLLTEVADKLMSAGFMNIYSETYEALRESVKQFDDKDKEKCTWMYKWENKDDAETYGPYDTETMKQWIAQDFFAGSQLVVRKISSNGVSADDDMFGDEDTSKSTDESSNAFVPYQQIDFNLYL